LALVVNRLPADWFPHETYAVLAQYCRHVIAAGRIAQLVAATEAADPFDVNYYDHLDTTRWRRRQRRRPGAIRLVDGRGDLNGDDLGCSGCFIPSIAVRRELAQQPLCVVQSPQPYSARA
jgi:hypothetical protein